MNKVILVDDEVFARQGLGNLIDWEQCGFTICGEAGNGEEALQLIELNAPNLVLTDIRMPEMDGLKLIQKVRENGNDKIKFIIVSGYNDFKYAQQAIKFGVHDFILKPIDEEELVKALNNLNEQIEKEKQLQYKQKAIMADTILKQLQLGELSSENADELSMLCNLAKSELFYYLIVEVNGILEYASDEQNGVGFAHIGDNIGKAVTEACGGNEQIYGNEQKKGVYGFLLPFRCLLQWENDPEKFAEGVFARLDGKIADRTRMYIGQLASGAENVGHAYRTANEAMRYKYAYPEFKLYQYDKLQSLSLTFAEIARDKIAVLLEQIEEHNEEALHVTIDNVFLEFQNKHVAYEAIKDSITEMVFHVIRAIGAMRGDKNDLLTLKPLMQWTLYPITLTELKSLFANFILESSRLIAKLRKANTISEISRVKSYIETHYYETISLKSISKKFYMNPVYMGQLFKKTFGVYFNDFLLHVRIQKAKELLRQTELRVYEIAESVGFSNADYFVYQFVKVEHCTPTEYRNALLQK
ncbi:MAG TPA: response regulator [Bacilli bacterium]